VVLIRITQLLATVSVAATVLASAGVANAAIVAVSTGPETYATDVATFNTNVVCTFDAACLGPFSVTPAAGSVIQTGSNSLGAAPPGDTTAYLSVVGGGMATLAAAGSVITGLSFFMGSPDAYNSISFFSGSTLLQTIGGADFNGALANGNQTVGQRISFLGLPSNVTSVVFASGSSSFEVDRLVATAAPVPEAATWAMMILGMGMVGMGLRLRRRPMAEA
jgi:hypothetical protein